MRRWWRNWAKFDIIALGVGIALSALYVWFRQAYLEEANPEVASSPYFELWSNIAGGILGAWVSVRLLDTLIQAREKREQVRRNLLSNLNYISGEARRLLPKVYDFNLVTLQDELFWARKRYPNRQRHLSSAERSNVETAISQLELAIQSATAYIQAEKDLRASRYKVDDAALQVNDAALALEKQLRVLEEALPVDAAAVQALDTQVGQGKPSLSPADVSEVRAFLAALIDPNRKPGYMRVPAPRRVHLYDLAWFKQVERIYDELRDVAVYDPVLLATVVGDARAKLTADPLPPTIHAAIENYLDAMTQLGGQRTVLATSLSNLTGTIDAAVRDIMEESELD